MKIAIKESNRAQIDAALRTCNGHAARAHTYTCASEIIMLAENAEETLAELLPKSARSGASMHAVSGCPVPNSYKYARVATRVSIQRGSACWYLTAAHTTNVWQQGGRIGLPTLTGAQAALALAKTRAKFEIEIGTAEVAA